jgi:flagellar biosynthesis/type III secretory pathway chaperone
MLTNLFSYLKHEQNLLKELLTLADKQQKALIKFNTKELESITAYQVEVSTGLKDAEEHRITMLMNLFGIARKDAVNLTLSSLERYYQGEDLDEIRQLRLELRALTSKLQSINTMNRVLANRARNSVGELLSVFTNGTNRICNVKI